ncbi:uncharacterized protein LOC121876849 isoform X1 [Homarus americanus]|uniref:uncharacterized protein LOC121876849 isoform X1 n=1 Tax=Homarus americanus TaxID=6706 RepID=UPI001C45EA46|nr:uncharacterized protein LOC121876849 isoform X1 [Homarus americanus]
MAVVWRSVVTSLTVLVLFIINTSNAHINDADYNRYVLYDEDAREVEDFEFQPLDRQRRDVRRNPSEVDDMDSKMTVQKLQNMKSAVTLKNYKGDKNPLITDMKKKPTLLKSPTTVASVATPSDSVSVNTSTSGEIPVTTSTTTTITTTVTSTPMPNNETQVNIQDNRTGGLTTASQNVTEEKHEDSVTPLITTANVTVSDSSSLDDVDSPVHVEVNDDNTDSDIEDFIPDNTTIDNHKYYRSHTYLDSEDAQHFWVDLDSLNEEKVITNEMLSTSHRRAATVTLTFEFPFYGHKLRNITIATGGFLFTGQFVHTWLAATQYIAPLMANFDTSMSNDAYVMYADNGTSFTVQWNNVLLKDRADAGTFTFQATLHKSGDIVFTYKQVPVIITAIGDDHHPVKVGLSDAYIVDRTIFFVRRKTIYEYHKIDMKKNSMIGNWTAILFEALPTCVSINSCSDCLSPKISFQCQWCSRIARCSNGLDRHRQEWLHHRCEAYHVQNPEECVEPPATITPVDTFGHNASVEPYSKGSQASSATNNSSSRGSNLPNQDTSASLPSPDLPLTSTNASAFSLNNTSNQNTSFSPPSYQVPSASPFLPHPSPFPPSSTPLPSSPSALDASDENRVILSDGEPDTLASTSGRGKEQSSSSVGTVIGVVFLVALVLGIAGWVTYAYFFPHSASGQILIQYRPSTWSWKMGEARYTAASIHSIHM